MIPILLENNPLRCIGKMRLTDEGKKLLNNQSVFSIGFIQKQNDKIELINLSLTTDEKYKKFLNQKK